jgi:hypothetical protein
VFVAFCVRLSPVMRSHVGASQLLGAKHVQRQIADVGVVVTVKEAALLLAVQRVICGVKVQRNAICKMYLFISRCCPYPLHRLMGQHLVTSVSSDKHKPSAKRIISFFVIQSLG